MCVFCAVNIDSRSQKWVFYRRVATPPVPMCDACAQKCGPPNTMFLYLFCLGLFCFVRGGGVNSFVDFLEGVWFFC